MPLHGDALAAVRDAGGRQRLGKPQGQRFTLDLRKVGDRGSVCSGDGWHDDLLLK